MAAMDTGERRLSPSVGLIDHTANRACSARVARIDGGYRNARQFRLVSKELAKLGKGPTVQTVALGFSGLNPFAYVRQVFDGNRKVGAFCSRNNLLRDAVVDVFAEAGLLPGKFLETALCRLRSFSLQARFTLGELGSNTLNIGSRIGIPVTVESDVNDAEVNAKNSFDPDFFRVRHVTNASEIPLALDEHQIDFAFAVGEQRPLALAAHEGNLDAAFKRPDRNGVAAHKAEYPVIVRLGRMLAEMALTLPVELIGVSRLRDTTDRNLSGKAECLPALRIGDLVESELLEFDGFPCLVRKPVTSLIATLKRLAKSLFLLSRWQQLDVCNQLHASYIEAHVLHFKRKQQKKGREFLPGLKAEVSFAQD